MDWLKIFKLFLFDFDGLLVNTEHFHFQAYIDMCERRGFHLDWDFLKYCSIAHLNNDALKEAIYAQFPQLFEKEPNWEVLRKEKNNIYLDLLRSGKVGLMPGAFDLLNLLKEKNIKRCIVTNALKEQVDIIKKTNPILNSVPYWVTREQYLKPKPDPECYLRAIELYAQKGDNIIGFEDTLRGLKALLQTSAQPVLICHEKNFFIFEAELPSNIFYYQSLKDFSDLLS
jgi:beta-phosphoglucomutase